MNYLFQMDEVTVKCSPVILSSAEGSQLLEEVKLTSGPFHVFLSLVYCKQRVRNSCGIHSCGLILNAHYKSNCLSKEIVPEITELPYSEKNMIEHKLTVAALTYCNVLHTWRQSGVTLSDIADILIFHGCKVEIFYASSSSVKEFRCRTIDALSKSSCGVIVNFNRTCLGQGYNYAHHSPLGAYHEKEDKFLIYDTGSEPASWVTSKSLFAAMNTIDLCSNKSRGYLIAKMPGS